MPTDSITWEFFEMSAYQPFRQSEAEFLSGYTEADVRVTEALYGHCTAQDTDWVDGTANPDWERTQMDAYDASLKSNGMV